MQCIGLFDCDLLDSCGVAFTAEFDILYGEGISAMGELIDLAVEFGVVKKAGSLFLGGLTNRVRVGWNPIKLISVLKIGLIKFALIQKRCGILTLKTNHQDVRVFLILEKC